MTSSRTRVSVIIPTYNRADLLPSAIDSVLAQVYEHVEIIVVDDGSTDHTPDVLRQYGTKVRTIRQANAGASAARNHGIRISQGEIVAFLDSDDTWLPVKLARQISILDRAGSRVPCCVCNMKLAYADGRTGTSFDLSLIKPRLEEGLWTNALQVLATRFVLFNQCVAVRRSELQALGGFDERYAYMEDYDLALRLAMRGPWCYVASPLAVWNEGTVGSLTTRAAGEHTKLQRTIFDIRQKVSALAEREGCDGGRVRQLAFEVRRQQVRLMAAKLSDGSSGTQRLCGWWLSAIERLVDKIYTNSPIYPAMKVAAL